VKLSEISEKHIEESPIICYSGPRGAFLAMSGASGISELEENGALLSLNADLPQRGAGCIIKRVTTPGAHSEARLSSGNYPYHS
jgi:hypothetical protein